jgi:predicted nucleic acid-binding protein
VIEDRTSARTAAWEQPGGSLIPARWLCSEPMPWVSHACIVSRAVHDRPARATEARAHARSRRRAGASLRNSPDRRPSSALADAAGDVAERFDLRAYDAVHLASAMEVDDGSIVVVTWDRAPASAAGLDAAPPV